LDAHAVVHHSGDAVCVERFEDGGDGGKMPDDRVGQDHDAARAEVGQVHADLSRDTASESDARNGHFERNFMHVGHVGGIVYARRAGTRLEDRFTSSDNFGICLSRGRREDGCKRPRQNDDGENDSNTKGPIEDPVPVAKERVAGTGLKWVFVCATPWVAMELSEIDSTT